MRFTIFYDLSPVSKMTLLDHLRSGVSRKPADNTPATVAVEDPETIRPVTHKVHANEKDAEAGFSDDVSKPWDLAGPDEDAQLGVQKIEAVTSVWTKKSLATLLIL